MFVSEIAGLIAALAAGVTCPPAGAPTVITFNELVQNTIVVDQYATQGVLFAVDDSAGYEARITDINPDAEQTNGASGLNTPLCHAAGGLRVFGPDFAGILTASFVDPADLTPAVASRVAFGLVSDAAATVSFRAYDASGSLIVEILNVEGGSGGDGMQAYEIMAISAPVIASVEIDGFSDLIMDYLDVTLVPPCSPADVTTDGTSNGAPDGSVTLSDFSHYLSLWAASDAAADVTTDGTSNGVPDGAVTLSDFSYYLSLWAAGCP